MGTNQTHPVKMSLIGLGKLGLCLAACFAQRGIQVLGVDVISDVVNKINAGESPIIEPGLAEAINETAGKTLFATTDATRAITETDISYILVNTPSDSEGNFLNTQVEQALETLGMALAQSDKESHLFVISSTVMPGSITGSFIPLLEKTSGRKLHKGFDVAFCPDFVALGQVINDFYNPDFVLIGESSTEAGDVVERLHRTMCKNQPPIRRMTLSSAELAKVSLNAYITLKISFANTLANLAEQLPGVDVDKVTAAIGLDKRISPYYLKGGLAFGGTCFPRDTRAFRAVAARVGIPAELIDAAEIVNVRQDRHLLESTLKLRKKTDDRIAVLGLSFKPKTPVIVESPGVKLVKALLERGVAVAVYDPLAMDALREQLGSSAKIYFAQSAEDCLANADVAILTLVEDIYRDAIYALPKGKSIRILDCWRQLDVTRLSGEEFFQNALVLCLGQLENSK